MTKPIIGFIGQGYIGKNYADDFERRGYTTVRYALEEPYRANKDRIRECEVVFIAVPTPTRPEGFDATLVEESIGLVAPGRIAVVKSTIVPGTIASFAERYPDRIVLYSPEFLSEATAAEDAANPFSNIVGVARETEEYRKAAELVHSILPKAPYARTCSSTEAELIKYAHNGSGYVQILFFNLMYDLAQKLGADWSAVEEALQADRYICNRYARPVHKSGRGAGGNCFIKDFAALRELYRKATGDELGSRVFEHLEEKNKELLKATGKDLHLLASVYGKP